MTMTKLRLSCEVDLPPGETLVMPEAIAKGVGPGRWRIIVEPADSEEINRSDEHWLKRANGAEDATEYLLSNPANARELHESITQFKAGRTVEKELIE